MCWGSTVTADAKYCTVLFTYKRINKDETLLVLRRRDKEEKEEEDKISILLHSFK